MGDWLIFIPNVPAVPEAMLRQFGVDELVTRGYHQGELATGPDGKQGAMVAMTPRLRYDAETQKWFPAPDQRYYLGYTTDNPPAPRDIVRERIVTGKVLKLADGNEWICPTARLYDGVPQLPMRLGLDELGNDTAEVVAEYRELWELACEVQAAAFGEMQDPDTPAMSGERTIEAATKCLATNYRLNLTAIKVLGLLSTENVHEILRTLVDFETYRAMLRDFLTKEEKKKSTPDALATVGEGTAGELPADDGGCDDDRTAADR